MDKMTRSVQSAAMRKGTMLMEFVLTMPILFMLIMLVIQFAQVMLARQMVAYAAFCSTRSMLCSKPSEWQGSGKSSCAHQAARRSGFPCQISQAAFVSRQKVGRMIKNLFLP